MIVAVRPPEYFPRPAYAALLLHADRFVVADTFPYSRQGFQNRCRVRTAEPLDAGTGWAWLTVPLVGGAVGQPLREVAVVDDGRWRRVHRKTLRHHYGSAPFYPYFAPELDALLATPAAALADLTVPTVAWTAQKLKARAEVVAASRLPGAPATLPDVLAATGATTLLTLPESAEGDRQQAEAAGFTCRVLRVEETPRRQNFPGFVPECASLDLLMNYGPEAAARLAEDVAPPV